jgi:hypothetical protein
VVKHLLDESSLRYYSTKVKASALIAAATNGHEQVVKHLLNEGSLCYYSTKARASALIAAAMKGHEGLVRALCFIDKITRLNRFDESGRTALHYAAQYGHEALVKMLLIAAADVTISDKAGCTPLHSAAISGENLIEFEVVGGRKISSGQPAHPPDFLLLEMELGLGIHIKKPPVTEQSILGIDSALNVNCIYDLGNQAITEAITSSSLPLEVFNILQDKTFTSQVPAWGEFLHAASFRLILAPNFSVVL